MSRRIRLWHVNVVLYAVIACVAAIYWQDLKWAWAEFPKYLQDDIGSPEERRMYRKARRIIKDGGDLEEARKLVQASLAIDPNGEAGYWLGRYHYEAGHDDEAIAQLERYLEIDPAFADAYWKIAAAHERSGRPAAARAILERGATYFGDNAERYRPQEFDDVRRKFGRKARRAYEMYVESAEEMREEILRLAGPAPHAPGAPAAR